MTTLFLLDHIDEMWQPDPAHGLNDPPISLLVSERKKVAPLCKGVGRVKTGDFSLGTD
jgi:hypothetical protein